MGTVSISGKSFTIYGEQSDDSGAPPVSATTYFIGQINATGWDAASTSDRAKALVSATRILDKQLWAGSPTTPGQAQAWPRTGATDLDGNAIGTSVIPDEVVYATYELAGAILTTASVGTAAGQGTNVKRELSREKVGELEVETETEYFTPTIGNPKLASRFPAIVQEYLRGLLASGAIAATVTGSAASNFAEDDFGFNDPGL